MEPTEHLPESADVLSDIGNTELAGAETATTASDATMEKQLFWRTTGKMAEYAAMLAQVPLLRLNLGPEVGSSGFGPIFRWRFEGRRVNL